MNAAFNRGSASPVCAPGTQANFFSVLKFAALSYREAVLMEEQLQRTTRASVESRQRDRIVPPRYQKPASLPTRIALRWLAGFSTFAPYLGRNSMTARPVVWSALFTLIFAAFSQVRAADKTAKPNI